MARAGSRIPLLLGGARRVSGCCVIAFPQKGEIRMPLATEATRFLRVWIRPERKGLKPLCLQLLAWPASDSAGALCRVDEGPRTGDRLRKSFMLRILLVQTPPRHNSRPEVAELLGLSVANAKTRVPRARLFLRQHLAASLMTAHEGNVVRVRGRGDWRTQLP